MPRISSDAYTLEPTGRKSLPADIVVMTSALRSIGYSFEQAIADIIDNCIDHDASTVLVRFVATEDGGMRVIVADNGTGMSEAELLEAMRLGSKVQHKPEDLAKYGMGLKLASLSQCRKFTVATRKTGACSACRWTLEGLRAGYLCDIFSSSQASLMMQAPLAGLKTGNHGTIVIWDDIDRVAVDPESIDATISKLIRTTQPYLGLHFHRYLGGKAAKALSIVLDNQTEGDEERNVPREVEPLDPFGYPASGKDGYPTRYTVNVPGLGDLRMKAHIWPPKSELPEYRLRGGANKHQGFYIYRNDRLIQAGGWCGVREAEPHASLARIAMEMSPGQDEVLSLDVKKGSIQTPPEFLAALRTTKGSNGRTFNEYVRDAETVYRKKAGGQVGDAPFVPGGGFSVPVREKMKAFFAGDERRVRTVDFAWEPLDDGVFFEIERGEKTIYLNAQYRGAVLGGLHGSSADAPLIKTLLFLLFRDEMDKARVSKITREWVELCNDALMLAVRELE